MAKIARKIVSLWLGLSSTCALADYTHEITGYLDLTSASGTISSGDTQTELKDNTLKGTLGYGYFLSDSVEPIFDFTLNNLSKTTGAYVNTWGNTEWNLGVLFNRPDGALDKDKRSGKKSEDDGPLMSSKWIPYGGFLIASRANTQSIGASSGSENVMVSKLMAGIRYMVFPHIGFNFWVKASYENSAATASADGEDSKGSISKLTLEFRLFSLSVFL